MGLFKNDMPVVGRVIVHFQDRGERVRPHEINCGDDNSDQETNYANDEHQPEAPAQVELQTTALHDYRQRVHGQHEVITDGRADQQEPVQTHRVRAVPGNGDQEQVHEDPRGEGGPQEDAGVVTSGTVTSAPSESLLAKTEVLGDR